MGVGLGLGGGPIRLVFFAIIPIFLYSNIFPPKTMKTLSDETLQQVAAFLRSVAGPTRLRILRCLHDKEKSVTEIVRDVRAKQSGVSKHLAILASAGVVVSRKNGSTIYYKISDKNVTSICDTVCCSIAERVRQQRRLLRNIQKHSKKNEGEMSLVLARTN